MFRGRGKKTVVAAGASVLMAAASLAIVPLVASAQGSAPTSTSVVAKPTSTVTGRGITIKATVVPVTGDASTARHAFRFRAGHRAATPNAGVPTGTVTFTITASNGKPSVACKTVNPATLMHNGKASCKVATGLLQAEGSPYTITAMYSGDSNFASSTGTTTETVGRARTHTKLRMGPTRPVDDSPNAVTATVKARGANGLETGTITFAVSSSPATGKTTCTNNNGSGKPKTYDTQPLAVSGNVATAVCDLEPGWFVVTKPTTKDPHSRGSWNVSGSYSGDGNFLPSTGKKGGHSNM
jgi:hypothetical protein